MHRNRCRGNVDLLPEATQKPRLETNLTREAEYSSTGSPIGSDKDCPSELNAFDGCQIQATLEFGGGKLGCRTGQGDQILCRNIERCLNVVMTENLAIARRELFSPEVQCFLTCHSAVYKVEWPAPGYG